MKTITLVLLPSACLFAQPQVIYNGPGAIDGYLAAHSGAAITKVEQAGITVKQGKQYTFIGGAGLTYKDSGVWKVTQPQIQSGASNGGWLQTGAPVRVEITRPDATSHLKVTGPASVLDLDVTGVSYSANNEFVFPNGGQTWTVQFLPVGAEIETTVAKRQGAKTYSFTASPSTTAQIDKKGNVTVGTDLILTHATMRGADHRVYPCGAWAASGKTISFTCDDTQMPDAALPYVIDPVTSYFSPTSTSCGGSDDGTTCNLVSDPNPNDNNGYFGENFTANFTISLPSNANVVSGGTNTNYSDNGNCNKSESFTLATGSAINWPTVNGQNLVYQLGVSFYDDGTNTYYCSASIADNVTVNVTYTQPPSATFSFSPANPVAGSWGTLTVNIQDAAGYPNLGGQQQIIVNGGLTYAGGCSLGMSGYTNQFPYAAATVTLLNDGGGGIGSVNLTYNNGGSGGPYSSNGCTIQGSGGSVSPIGTWYTAGGYSFAIPVLFLVGGNLNVYANLTNNDGAGTGWIGLGGVSVTKYTVATPAFTPSPGTYTAPQTVTISTSTSGASIRYTTDGSNPTETYGTLGNGPVQVSSTGTIKAIAYLTGLYDSAIGVGNYTITGTVATPTISPGSGTYNTPQTITISTSTPGATIRYTTDGSTPTETSGTVYAGGFTLAGTVNVKAIAYESQWNDSVVVSNTYSIYNGTVAAPTFSPGGGSYSSAQTVTISTSTPGATIRYTTDGSAPTESHGTAYSGPITVSTTTSISAMAYEAGWLDSSVVGATYSYGQVTPPSSGGGININTPPADSGSGLDPRRTGVRTLGAYWGAAGEQIDTDSGNLNFSLPLVTPKSRGWGVMLRLSYNSQMWRQDTAGTWLMGQDVGYGLGWRLQAGSLAPVWANSTIDHYLFTDASGAEYGLTINNGGLWTSQEGTYITYDSNANRIYFPDGSYWVMGATSSGGEPDSGTMYPTAMEDSNGNQIWIQYAVGAGSSSMNTSARITYILDARPATTQAAQQYWNNPQIYGSYLQADSSYVFSYNSDPIPHLISVRNALGTAENYDFGYLEGQPLNSPFTGASYGTTALLSTVAITYQSISNSFQYGSATGEMVSYTTPLGGTLGWQYRTFTYNGGISLREVQYRSAQAGPTASSNTWSFSHPDSYDASLTYHAWTDIYDGGAGTQKVYWPSVVNSGSGLVGQAAYEERNQNGAAVFDRNLGYGFDSVGNIYLGTATTTLDAGSANAVQTITYQTLDIYGNVTQQQVYDYGANSPTRTYNMTYLTDPNYVSRYIRNRPVSATLTDHNGVNSLVSVNYYDNVRPGSGFDYTFCAGTNDQDPGAVSTPPNPGASIPMHDSAYGTGFDYRGNLSYSAAYNGVSCYAYTTTGVAYAASHGGGTPIITSSPSVSTNYSLPGAITPNGQSNLATTVGYDTSWAVTSVTGPNGANGTTTYDSLGRPLSTKSADGSTTSYGYTYSPGANTQTATLENQWKKTTLDGFGRVISVQTGHDSTAPVSEVDTQYAPCACSPLGKMSAVSLPYAPGQTSPVWTTYTYDGSGRTLSVTEGDGSVTRYSYAGNTKTETDPAGKWKTFTTDAFGNLTLVAEPDPANQPNGTLLTYYTYDSVNHLIQVSMPRNGQNQIRSFVWSGDDMTSTTNPENGTVTYSYDALHHVTQRTDAKQQQTKYTYDAYGRLARTLHYIWGVPWSGAPPTNILQDQVDYYYDTPLSSTYGASNLWGRLAGVVWGGVGYAGGSSSPDMWYEYNYNQAGRVTGKRMAVPGSTADTYYDGTWEWDDRGRMTSMTTPGGSSYQYSYDAMSNLSQMTGSGISETATYNWAGQRLTLNGETRSYNSLLQLVRIQNSGFDEEYIYQAGQNNGRIVKSIDHVRGETVDYTYDPLNRLLNAEEENGKWGNAFSYDGWGNMNGQTFTPGYAATPGTVTPPGPHSGDANGNTGTGTWDVENRLISTGPLYSPQNYWYDPFGKRVKTCCTTDQYGNQNPTYVYYGVDGKRLETYAPGPQTQTDVYFGGTKVMANGMAVSVDRVGSVRSNANGSIAYYPYGQERTSTPNGVDKFGTYFRDAAGQDYADQRYYNPNSGTFWSPDPMGLRGANLKNPTSWNRYLYALGDPVNRTDRHGLHVDTDGDDGSGCYWDPDDEMLHCTVTSTGSSGSAAGVSSGPESCEDNPYQPQCAGPAPNPSPIAPDPEPEPDPPANQDCLNALAADKKDMSAVQRALAAKDVLLGAVQGTGLDWTMLAAIGVRESGFLDITEADGAGVGVGIFQLTVSATSGISATQAHDLETAANYAAMELDNDMTYLAGKFPNFTAAQLLQATAAAYNFGTGNISGNPNTIDVGTARGNYGSNVIQLMTCFH